MRISTFTIIALLTSTVPAYSGNDVIERTFKSGMVAAQQGDSIAAFRQLLIAAKGGHTAAQYHVGHMYYVGTSEGGQDYREAAKWLLLAADAGHLKAQTMLGNMYARGYGVPLNDKISLKWTQRAAEGGDPVAQVAMAARYADGRGVPQDYVQTHKWLILAWDRLPASQEYIVGVAMRIMKATITRMSGEERAEAKRLAEEWTSK